jgi:hypothetical protein
LDEPKVDSRKYSEIFKIINKNVYLILALMVFLGFFQQYIYYQNFDIGLYNYSSPFELLFYFIPEYIISPLKILFKILKNPFFQILFVIYAIYLFYRKKYELDRISNYLKNNLGKIKNVLYCINYLYIIIIFFLIIRLIYGLLSLENLSDFDFYISDNFINSNGYSNAWFQILYLLWSVFTVVSVYKGVLKIENIKNFGNKVSIIIVSILIVMFIFESLKTTQKIASLKKRIPIQKVRFIYNNDTINTDDNNLYIGSTKDYLFIRNFDTRKNKLYNINDVKFLESTLK